MSEGGFISTIRAVAISEGGSINDLLINNLNGYCKTAVDCLLEKGHITEIDIERCKARAAEFCPKMGESQEGFHTPQFMAVYWRNIAAAALIHVPKNFLDENHKKYGGRDAEVFKAATDALCQIAEYVNLPDTDASGLPDASESATAKLLLMWSIGGTCETLAGLGLAGFDSLTHHRRQRAYKTAEKRTKWQRPAFEMAEKLREKDPKISQNSLAEKIRDALSREFPNIPKNLPDRISEWENKGFEYPERGLVQLTPSTNPQRPTTAVKR